MPWRDQMALQCPHCVAEFRASSPDLLVRILDEHVGLAHGKTRDDPGEQRRRGHPMPKPLA